MNDLGCDTTVCWTLVVLHIGTLLFIVSIVGNTIPLVKHERNDPTDIAAFLTPEGHKVRETI